MHNFSSEDKLDRLLVHNDKTDADEEFQPFQAEAIQRRNKKYFKDDGEEKRKMVIDIL